MTNSFAGKHAFVSGSSRGIGAQVAQMLAAQGATVAINYRDKVVRAEKIANQIIEAGGKAIVVGADLTDYSSIDALAATLKAEFGGLDLLVLNASGGMETGRGEDYAMKLNRDAQVNLVKTLLPLMHSGSRIVFVTSRRAASISRCACTPPGPAAPRSPRFVFELRRLPRGGGHRTGAAAASFNPAARIVIDKLISAIDQHRRDCDNENLWAALDHIKTEDLGTSAPRLRRSQYRE